MLHFWHWDSDKRICYMKVFSADHNQRKYFSNLFTSQDGICFCHNLADLLDVIGIAYNSSEWHLFIGSSTKTLKHVLFHNRNMYPSLPLAHRNTAPPNSCSKPSNMQSILEGGVIETLYWWPFWLVSEAALPSFRITLIFGRKTLHDAGLNTAAWRINTLNESHCWAPENIVSSTADKIISSLD